jgi:hypothetical protein
MVLCRTQFLVILVFTIVPSEDSRRYDVYAFALVVYRPNRLLDSNFAKSRLFLDEGREGILHICTLLNCWKDNPHYMPAPTNNPASDTS